MIPIRRALISVSDKTGLLDLARYLSSAAVEILSTGGTAAFLRQSGIPVKDVSEHTGFPEILDGRVKTLHPMIHGGLLAIRNKAAHRAQLQEQGIQEIDMVVVNLYPFRETAARSDATFAEIVEQIDIGGPSMIRSAAKNHSGVAVVTDPGDYEWIVRELKENGCSLSDSTRFVLAQKAFATTASYDAAIATYLSQRSWSADGAKKANDVLPAREFIDLEKVKDLRYGENPHQRAALYRRIAEAPAGVAGSDALHGKELSYNNLLDADGAWNLILEFDKPACAIIKHTNPCGAAQGETLLDAYVRALECDPVSAFGSVVAFNRTIDEQTAVEMNKLFIEVALAPNFDEKAIAILKQKKNLRLLRIGTPATPMPEHRQIGGGFLVQDRDSHHLDIKDLKIVTRREPTASELEALLFGWRVVKHVKSNAIVFSDASRMLGVGAGQMSRVDSVKWGAQRATLPLQGCAMASDAFFPFPDGLEAAAAVGVRSVIQPGGSVRDAEVIQAADAREMAMVFTGIRHFKH